MEMTILTMRKTLFVMFGILLIGGVLAMSATQSVTVTVLPMPDFLKIFSPINDNIYNERMILVNVTASNITKYLEYSDNGGSFRTLCRKCNRYSREKPFDDGTHQLLFKGIFNTGIVYEQVNFTVDTKDPKITRTSPIKGFSEGIFEVEFQEENPKELFLNYGNNITGMRNVAVDLNSCTGKKNWRENCSTTVDLADYDSEKISYWFNMTDIANNYDESKKRKLDVDVTNPVFDVNYTIKKRKVSLSINVTELNFDKVSYIDNSEKNPKWKTLCYSLKNGICAKSRNFKIGEHNITIEVVDKAGNSDKKDILFFIF